MLCPFAGCPFFKIDSACPALQKGKRCPIKAKAVASSSKSIYSSLYSLAQYYNDLT